MFCIAEYRDALYWLELTFETCTMLVLVGMRAPGSIILPGEAISYYSSPPMTVNELSTYVYVSISGGAGHPSGPISDRSLVVCSHFANYDQFSVGDEDSEYTLSVLGYQSASTAGHRTSFRIHQH